MRGPANQRRAQRCIEDDKSGEADRRGRDNVRPETDAVAMALYLENVTP